MDGKETFMSVEDDFIVTDPDNESFFYFLFFLFSTFVFQVNGFRQTHHSQ